MKTLALERLEDWTAILRLGHSLLSEVSNVTYKIQQLLLSLVCPLLHDFTTDAKIDYLLSGPSGKVRGVICTTK